MIYDCFTYFNEAEILEIRVNELAPLKPTHVLIESKYTFTGKEKILEVGTGSGYQAAILSQIVYRVYTIERIYNLYVKARKLFDRLGYHNIVTRYSDGTTGWKDERPFDAIIITAAAPEIPAVLIDQLSPNGRLVMPVGSHLTQRLIKLVRDDKGIHQTSLGDCRFVKLVGEHGWNQN